MIKYHLLFAASLIGITITEARERTYPFSLPPLGYSYTDLEPHIDSKTMKIHYTKHHATYIDNLNKALKSYPDLHTMTLKELVKNWTQIPAPIQSAVRNNAGGHLNHSDFWLWMTPNATSIPEELAVALTAAFGSMSVFKEQFKNEALKVFGSGWAWLCVNDEGDLVITSTTNQDNPITHGLRPILGLDVWEHAYYLKYQNQRPEYLDAWWNVVNWPRVAQLYGKYTAKKIAQESGVVIIPGITGDLAKRKLIPALFESLKKGNKLFIVGTGRKDAKAAELVATFKTFFKNTSEASLKLFEESFIYHKLDAQNEEDYKKLAVALEAKVVEQKLGDVRVVYLSTPSGSFCDYTQGLVKAGILVKGNDRHRIAYEKPFGTDRNSAASIESCIQKELIHEQVYHIDHYLAKPLIMSIPSLRADNEIFKEAWSNKTISSITIRMNETIDIEERGYFYEEYGVLKDVIQNHGLQLLATVLMDDTIFSQARAKQAALAGLRVTDVTLGQYEGYTESKDVKKDSKIPTFARVSLVSDEPRWKNVPFVIEAGKALDARVVDIEILFKSKGKRLKSKLVLQLSPSEEVKLNLRMKKPTDQLASVALDSSANPLGAVDAYEIVVDHIIAGMRDLVVSPEEIAQQWRIIEDIQKLDSEPKKYAKGTHPS